MKWRRYIWTATILVIWVISLMIVDSAAKQTRMGYQRQKLLRRQMELTERNLRLQCEVSVLHDLEKADAYAAGKQFRDPGSDQMLVPGESIDGE
ncbi:MAG TPA: hypothetical protein PLV45_07920 [bacterium]|nr:hypothetical protein [bacterium]